MVERLYYTNSSGEVTEFSVYSDFHVDVARDVDGLSDVSSKISASTTIGQDGETFVASAIEARDIQLTGHLRAASLPRQIELRQRLNHVMSPKGKGELTYVCGTLRRRIACYAETAPNYTPGRFPQFMIQLRCPSPFWQEETQVEAQIVEWEGGMIFDDADGLELTDEWTVGHRTGDLIVSVENAGDVACGMKIIFEAEGTVVNPMLTNAVTLAFVKVNTEMVSGDRIEITTAYGQKKAVLIRGGVTTNIFRLLDQETTFLQLAVGDNLFACDADQNAANLIARIQFSNQYLGV